MEFTDNEFNNILQEILPKEDEIPQELLTYIVSIIINLVEENKNPTYIDFHDAISPFLQDCSMSIFFACKGVI